jgi:mevalonate kinase
MGEALSSRIFHGKLLLFGEHSVLDGSKALVIPYTPVSAQFATQNAKEDPSVVTKSNQSLQLFASYLEAQSRHTPGIPVIDTFRFRKDLKRGLFFRSEIPEQRGLGSSGAVVAAVYNEYGPFRNADTRILNNDEIQSARIALASMESHFHAQSSGIDPLCIYTDKPLIAEGRDRVAVCTSNQLNNPGVQIFLMDTGLTGNTGDLVKGFRSKLQDQGLKESYTRQYIPFVNHMVDKFVHGLADLESLLQLSVFQSVLFRDLIPGDFQSVWQFGIDTEYYACKLCGSGGGGYILGFTEDFEKARLSLAGHFNIKPLWLRTD